jgi:SAM-dependent methyltransferase
LAEQPLQDLVARLERERIEADRRYRDALTALDAAVRALPGADSLPAADAPAAAPALHPAVFAGPAHATRSPGGLLRAFVWRAVAPAFDAQQQFNQALAARIEQLSQSQTGARRAIDGLRDAITADRAASARLHTDLVLFLQTITGYVDSKDRALGGPELREQIVLANERALALKREMDGLRAQGSGLQAAPATGNQQPATDFSYVGFEDRFRGSQGEIRERLKDYVPLFAQAKPSDPNLPTIQPSNDSVILDVGCGRGELLALLREAGVSARGIDMNGEMVALCREQGFDAAQADALGYLESQPDASLAGLAAIQVVEHLEPGYLSRFLEAAFHKLRPGAPIVLETINPGCWMAFFEAYLRDLTHAQPIPAETLRFLVQTSGFSSVDVQYRSPVTEADRLELVSQPDRAEPPALREAIDALNANAAKLNARLFNYMDYAIIARR